MKPMYKKLRVDATPSYKLSDGFTFIEILIVISLMIVVSISGIAAFVTYTNVQTFNAGVQDSYALLQQAKSNSSSQVKSAACNGQGVLHGYRVSICAMSGSNCLAGNDFELVARCGGAVESAATSVDRKGKKLPTGVTVNTATTNRSWFLFTVLRGGVINSSNLSSGIIAIQDSSSPPKIRQITVSSSGNISLN